MKRKCLTFLTLVLLASLLLTPVQATLTRYVWDNVYFMEGRDDQHDIHYPHPDRDYYNISRYTSWSIKGTKLYHEQMDYEWSQTNGACVLGVCTIIGTTIGMMIGHPEIGTVAGVVLGIVAVITNLQMQDEEGCIWWWMSVASIDWLEENQEMLEDMSISNPIGMYYLILDNFWSRGYLRLGSTSLWDAIDAGNPSPQPQTLSISVSSGGTTNPAPGTYTYDYGSSVTVTATANTYYAFDYWILDGATIDYNPITVTMDSNHNLKAYFKYGGGGDGPPVWDPCPTLFVWNGNDYVDYGVINIHNPTGEDVVREVPVLAKDVHINNHKATFRLREGWEGLNRSESVIDQVKLYAVDNDGNSYLCPLISAEHSRLGNVLPQLLLSDDVRAQILLLETVDLEFIVPHQNPQGFTFVIEGCNLYK
jgi:hypothetical protein